MIAYAKGELGEQTVSLKDVDRMIVIGSDRMMNGVKGSQIFDFAAVYQRRTHGNRLN